MFSVIYRGSIKVGKEDLYQDAWQKITQHFVKHCGAIGSMLNKTENGEWLAYSLWPDKQTRDNIWYSDGVSKGFDNLPLDIQKAYENLRECIDKDKPFEEIPMTVVHDMLGKK